MLARELNITPTYYEDVFDLNSEDRLRKDLKKTTI
jgi:hypothetical protein